MSTRPHQRGFTILDLLIVISLIGALLALLSVVVQRAREADLRSMPRQDQADRLVAGESRSALPTVSVDFQLCPKGSGPKRHGSTSLSRRAGRNRKCRITWNNDRLELVGVNAALLLREQFIQGYRHQFGRIQNGLLEFTTPPKSAPGGPFDKAIVNNSASFQHCSCIALSQFVCPSWRGNANTKGNSTIDTTNTGAVLRNTPSCNRWNRQPRPNGFIDTARTDELQGDRRNSNLQTAGTNSHAPVENGGLLLSVPQGLTAASFSDGLSFTLMVAETKECGYASWYDGTMNWLVTNSPSAKVVPGTNDCPPWINAESAINRGYNPPLARTAATATNVPWNLFEQPINQRNQEK